LRARFISAIVRQKRDAGCFRRQGEDLNIRDKAMNETRKRADVLLVERGQFSSRARAQAAIEAGLVRVNGEVLRKASVLVEADAAIEASPAHPWASRGGVKLIAALDGFNLDPNRLVALDVGASTGGFTDVLLARGAEHVYAVDVGRDQLDARLRQDSRVTIYEERDARALTPALFAAPPQAIVCDVSFISLRLVLPAVLSLAAQGAWLVALIKPQFEAGRARLRKGAVKDAAIQLEICDDIVACVAALGWRSLGVIPSPILGGGGAEEFLIGARHG
jgi:23S rRNA (cytidine1920-2'-O)/16S rRNA (cytidine1409-2'-O)-methyltransferase